MNRFVMSFTVNIKNDDIESVISEAEESSSYWCTMESEGECFGDTLAEHVINGGRVRIRDSVKMFTCTLTRRQIISAIQLYLQNPTAGDFLEFVDHELRVDTNYIDGAVADAIIQYAVNGEVLYK